MGQNHEKTMSDRVILISFLAGPIIWCSFCCEVDIKVSWAQYFFQIAHQNLGYCMQMNGTWPSAHYHDTFIFCFRNIPAVALTTQEKQRHV